MAQIGQVIALSGRLLAESRPDCLLILGDTNSGLSALAAARLGIPIMHLEAGNRCFDWRVPEEVNRRVIDHVSDWLLPYTPESRENLIREGIAPDRILISGNPITEVLEHFAGEVKKSDVLSRLGVSPQGYLLATLHREENVDNPASLKTILEGFELVVDSLGLPMIWSVHPRTASKLQAAGYRPSDLIQIHEPFGLFDFLALEKGALCVLTDSGTVQEECSLYRVPTVTVRETTERPETVQCGSNILSGTSDPQRLLDCVRVMAASDRQWRSPYDGDAGVSRRIVQFVIHRKPPRRQ
jgi:UDP-N-acetylglucosamine 2-epimerase (non-hydrolysing)